VRIKAKERIQYQRQFFLFKNSAAQEIRVALEGWLTILAECLEHSMAVAFGTYDASVLCFVHLDTEIVGDSIRIDGFNQIQLT
tara:strand:- start:190 stop:438 length:249 start_codon:yes stop_codon:yes gene_type:complete